MPVVAALDPMREPFRWGTAPPAGAQPQREHGRIVKQSRLKAIWATLALLAAATFPTSAGAQGASSNAMDDPAPFSFFYSHAYGFDGAFGFDQSRFYRFASAPGAFRPWHRDHRYRSDLIDRMVEIDRIRMAIVVLDILSNRRNTTVIVGR